MLLKEFPDLGWLKQQIDQRFQQRRAFNNLPLETDGFPNVIINTTIKEAYRPDIPGPISLFLNNTGTSYCTADGRKVCVNEEYYFITNRQQPYTLEIESRQPVETFNIHIGEHFSEGVLSALLTPADKILNDQLQQSVHTVAFHNRLYRRDDHFNELVHSLQQLQTATTFNKLLFEERMEKLLLHLLLQHRSVLKQADSLPPVKRSTKLELYRRLSMVTDYIHSCGNRPVELDEMAAVACLSKYHFLRLFKLAFGLSPYQYIQQLRLEKARQLLTRSSLPVQDIAGRVGFENSQSFSRLFYRRFGVYPSQYRA